MKEILVKIILTPIIPIILAYFELGGNWFAYRLIDQGVKLWSIAGTITFSVLYSLIAAAIALKIKLDLGLLMISYGFGFSLVAIFFKLEWGKLPEFSKELINSYSLLWIVGSIALVGFLISSYLVVTKPVGA